MYQRDVLRDVAQFQYPVQCRIATAKNSQFFFRELLRILHTVVQVPGFEVVYTGESNLPRLKGTDAAGDNDSLGVELCARIRFHMKGTITVLSHDGDFFIQVHDTVEWLDLFEQALG